MEVWREPVRGVYGDLAVLAMPGIDRFRRGFAGELAPPPIHHLTGMHPTEASQGRCVFAMPPTYRTPSPWELQAAGRLFTAAQLESLTGLEILRGSLDAHRGSLPAPPIHYLFGLRPVAADEGTSRWVMPATPWLSAGAPFMYGGAIALLADTALAGTAWTVSPGGTLPYTMDLNVRFLRPGLLEGELVAEGTVVHRGHTMVVSQARVTTGDGALVALADGSAALVPLDVRALPLEDAMADRPDRTGGPRPSSAPT